MARVTLGVILGLGIGLADVLLMLPLSFPDKRSALLGAFCARFALGFFAATVRLPWSPVVTGILVGLLTSLPDAIITKGYAPIMATGVVFGAIAGWIVGRWARPFSAEPVAKTGEGGNVNVSSNLSDRDTAEIRRMHKGFSEAIVTRDVAAILTCYTDDAVAMPPNYPAATGHAEIRAWLEAMPPIKRIDFVVEEIAGSGDLAMVRGTYSMSLAIPGEPQPVDDHGKYIEIRKRQPDGSWPMWRDIFNSSRPPRS